MSENPGAAFFGTPQPSIADEARAEAEKRWPIEPHGVTDTRAIPGIKRDRERFAEGADWLASRKPEAAPSCPTCRHAQHEGHQCLNMASDNECSCDKRVDEAAPSDTDREQVTPEALAAMLYSIEYQVDPDSATPDDVDERLGAADELIAWFAEHAPVQPVQVEVTDEAVQCSATHPNIDGGAPCRYLAGHTEAGLPHTTANGLSWHDSAQPVQVEVTDDNKRLAADLRTFAGRLGTSWGQDVLLRAAVALGGGE